MKNLLALLLLFGVFYLQAQDKLVDYNSKTQLVKIIEITDDVIKFIRFDNLDGPLYSENKSNYSTIIFENGSIEVLNKKDKVTYIKDKSHRPRFKLVDGFKKNTLELDVLAFYTKDVAIQYTRYLKNNKYAITIPLRLGWIKNGFNGLYLVDQIDYYDYYRNGNWNSNRRKTFGIKFLSGVNFKYFWRDTYKIRGYVAPELVFGFWKNKYTVYEFDRLTYEDYYTEHNLVRGTLGFMGVVGMIAQPNKYLNFKFEIAGGFVGFLGKDKVQSMYSHSYDQRVFAIGRMTFGIGVNF
jgi:hypothetical protein